MKNFGENALNFGTGHGNIVDLVSYPIFNIAMDRMKPELDFVMEWLYLNDAATNSPNSGVASLETTP